MDDVLNVSKAVLSSQFDDVFPEQHDLIYNVSRESIASEIESRGFFGDASVFMGCHSDFFVLYCPDCGFQYPVPVRCNFRLCPTCGGKRLNDMINRFVSFLPSLEGLPGSKGHRLRRFVMGLPRISVDDYSPDVYDDIRGCFNRLWRFKDFRSKFAPDVGGLCYAIETKFSKQGNIYFRQNGDFYVVPEDGFNVHIHGFAFSKFINQKYSRELSRLWSRATDGRANNVYIDLSRKHASAIGESLKYMFKPPVLGSAFNYGLYHEYTKGVRLFATKGSFRGVSLSKKPLTKDKVRLSCHFDGTHLSGIGSAIGRDEALNIVLNRKVPSRFLDSYMKSSSKGLIVPVVVEKNV